MLPVAILAGGLATRLRPLTEHVPKALLRIAGRPFIVHQLELLRSQGLTRVVLCVGHLGEQIQAAVGDGGALGLAIDYSYDGHELLGTGGALKRALPLLGDAFFVLNGDSYLTFPFAVVQSAFLDAGRPALMTVLRNDNRWDRSNVRFKDGELIEYDKQSRGPDMSHIDYGVSILSKDVFVNYEKSNVLDLADICRNLSMGGQLAALEVSGRFYEIGSPQGMRDTEEFLSRKLQPA
jgi:N-acetyl-alpha-D-muramate 1-phosphate uridylyltransferase